MSALSTIRGALLSASASCPLYPRKRTFGGALGMSALCQKRTSFAARILYLLKPATLLPERADPREISCGGRPLEQIDDADSRFPRGNGALPESHSHLGRP